MLRRYLPIAALGCGGLVAGCAFDVIHVEQTPAELVSTAAATPSFLLDQDLDVDLPFGYRRVLRKGTRWTHVGSIEQGDVYTSKDQVLTIEASNVYEAYIVVSNAKLVGFYLPVERTYSPLGVAKPLQSVAASRR